MNRGPHGIWIFSPEEDQLIRKQLSEGKTQRQVAQELGVSQHTIHRYIYAHDLITLLDLKKIYRAPWSKEITNKMIDLYVKDGLSLSEVGRQLGIHTNRVGRHLIKNGVTLRDYYIRPETRQSMMADYVHSGLHRKQICAKYGVSLVILRRLIKQHNLQRLKGRVSNGRWTHSSRGYEGWYKGHYFRSKSELFFMIDILEKQQIPWESGENPTYAIPYIDETGYARLYYPDFITPAIVYEIKPIEFWTTNEVHLKTEAASLKCKEWGKEYVILDPNVDDQQWLRAYDAGHIKWTEHTQKRFDKKYGQVRKNSATVLGLAGEA
jgi:transposase-like protein